MAVTYLTNEHSYQWDPISKFFKELYFRDEYSEFK